MNQRCDGKIHCADSSDEHGCSLIVPNEAYNKHIVPPPVEGKTKSLFKINHWCSNKGEEHFYVNVSFDLHLVLNINEEENLFELTYTIVKKWYNCLLDFQHLKRNGENRIFPYDKETMYLPWIEEINLRKAGACLRTSKEEILKVIPKEDFQFEHSHLTDLHNAYWFKGSESILLQSSDWICEYICQFEYNWYPFDTQNCFLINNVTSGLFRLRVEDVKYTGSGNVGRYYFDSINHCEVDKLGRSGIIIDFTIKRPIMNNLLTVYLPTAMLLIISQMSTAYDHSSKELVIEVNTTLLLVLTTLYLSHNYSQFNPPF